MQGSAERAPSPRTRDGRAYWLAEIQAAECEAAAHGVTGEIRLHATYGGTQPEVQLWAPDGPRARVVGTVKPGVVEVSVDPAVVRQWLTR